MKNCVLQKKNFFIFACSWLVHSSGGQYGSEKSRGVGVLAKKFFWLFIISCAQFWIFCRNERAKKVFPYIARILLSFLRTYIENKTMNIFWDMKISLLIFSSDEKYTDKFWGKSVTQAKKVKKWKRYMESPILYAQLKSLMYRYCHSA